MATQLSEYLIKKLPATCWRGEKPSDIKIVISCEKIAPSPDHKKQADKTDTEWTVNYQVFLPAVYGKEPVGNFFVKEKIANRLYTPNNALNLLLSKLSEEYAWKEVKSLVEYLQGDTRFQPYLRGRLATNGQDIFAARLLALSDWKALLAELTNKTLTETLIKSGVMAPFSENLSEKIYAYAKEESELKEKIELISYLYVAGFSGITDLINEVLSEQKDFKEIGSIQPIVSISGQLGNNETREHLMRLWEDIPKETPDKRIQNFRDTLAASLKALSN